MVKHSHLGLHLQSWNRWILWWFEVIFPFKSSVITLTSVSLKLIKSSFSACVIIKNTEKSCIFPDSKFNLWNIFILETADLLIPVLACESVCPSVLAASLRGAQSGDDPSSKYRCWGVGPVRSQAVGPQCPEGWREEEERPVQEAHCRNCWGNAAFNQGVTWHHHAMLCMSSSRYNTFLRLNDTQSYNFLWPFANTTRQLGPSHSTTTSIAVFTAFTAWVC